MTVFITDFLKSAAVDGAARWLRAIGLLVVMAMASKASPGAELSQLKVVRGDDGLFLSALVQFDLPLVVEDALAKGIPMFFVVEADIYRDRWYWTDRRVASATRTIRLTFQPLSRHWRVNIATGLINNSAGLRATLNQNYDTLPEALSAVQRLSRWKIAEATEVDAEAPHRLEFSFRLDLSQLPRPFQIGVAGQRDWTIAVQSNDRLNPERLPPERAASDAVKPASAAPLAGEKSRISAP